MNKEYLLSIHDLHVEVEGKKVLENINISLPQGQVHVLIGSNGAGKSSFAHTLVGQPRYHVVKGRITFQGKNLLDMSIEQRAHAGLFMTFQQPIPIAGIRNMHFLKTALDMTRKARGLPPLSPAAWLDIVKKETKAVGLDFSFLARSLNEGFSGGEKKRNELLQMRLLQPQLVIFDEIDSGLDSTALQLLIQTIHDMQDGKHSFIFITHYPALIEAIQPHVVYHLHQGRIQDQGDIQLARKILKQPHSHQEPQDAKRSLAKKKS